MNSLTGRNKVNAEDVMSMVSNSEGDGDAGSYGKGKDLLHLTKLSTSEKSPDKDDNLSTSNNTTSGEFTKKLAQRKYLLKKLRMIACVQFVLAILGVLFMLIDNELFIRGSYTKTSVTSKVLRAFVSIFTVLLICSLIFHSVTIIRMRKITNSFSTFGDALTMSDIVRLAVEIVVCVVHPIAYTEQVLVYIPKSVEENGVIMAYVDGILCVIMCFRLYIVVRFIAVTTDMYMDTSLRSLCAVNGIDVDTLFIVKAYLSRFPGIILMVCVVGIVGINSWALRTCEFYYTYKTPLNLKESLWIVVITFLTVGYGDITPQTYCGRFIAVMTGALGVCATALIIALLSKKLEQSKQEKLISHYAIRAGLEKKKKKVAVAVVRNSLKVWVQKRRGNPRPNYTERLENGLQKGVNRMQEIRQNKFELKRK